VNWSFPQACMSGGLVALGMLMPWLMGGCATSEETRQKSKGYYQEGMASLERDRQKAYVSFQKAVQLDPDNKEAEFRKAVKIDDNYSEAHTYLGQVLAYQDRWPEAIAEFRLALTNPLYSTPDLARFQLGKALAHEGDYQGAMEALEDALAVNPPNVPPAMLQLELGKVYYKLGFERRAKEALTKVTTLDKTGPHAAAAKEILARLKP
jgi:type IV pilus assembly protein PilF